MSSEILFENKDHSSDSELQRAMQGFKNLLPKGSEIHGCIHQVGPLLRAHFDITVDGELYRFPWTGRRVRDLVQFIEGNLHPILKTWNRSLPEFFQRLAPQSGLGSDCGFCQSMSKEA